MRRREVPGSAGFFRARLIRSCARKCREKRGIVRAAVLLMAAIAVLLIAILVPVLLYYVGMAGTLECRLALDRAKREISWDYLMADQEQDAGRVISTVTAVPGRERLCPAGGTVYVLPSENQGEELEYTFFCGLHGSDAKKRTRLNALRAFELLREAVYEAEREGDCPEELIIPLNDMDLRAGRLKTESGIHRGTYSSTETDEEYLLQFLLYGTGDGSDSAGGSRERLNDADYGRSPGEVCWFVYADPDHAAVWTAGDGWSGDSYTGE